MIQKSCGVTLIFFFIFLCSAAYPLRFPLLPARIGGTLTVDNVQILNDNDAGYTLVITTLDGTPIPKASDTDGLSNAHLYMIDIPIYEPNDEPQGGHPGDLAVLHVYHNGTELTVTSPLNGEFMIGESASATTINVAAVHGNRPPMAMAGTDQTVEEGAEVTLNASNSSDPEGDVLIYEWEQIAGTLVTLSDPTSEFPAFTAPEVGFTGESLIFELTVTDTGGLTDTDRVTVNVTFVNHPPKADAGEDQHVTAGEQVTLDGSASSDPDDGIAQYEWQQVSGLSVSLSDATSVQPTFTAPYTDAEGEILVFELTVTDNGGLRDTDQVIIKVIHVNQPPVANAGPDQTVNEGESVTLDGSASSDDNAIVQYSWLQTAGKSVQLSDKTAVMPSFKAPSVKITGDYLIFKLTVTDAGGLTASDSVRIDILSVNQPPVANAGPDQTVSEGETVTLDGSASYDPDGEIVAYLWRQINGTSVMLSDPTQSRTEFVAQNGNLTGESLGFELTVTDNKGLEKKDYVIINVTAGNQAPVADAGSDQTVRMGDKVLLDGSDSYDPDGTIVTYTWRQISGTPMKLSDVSVARPTFKAENTAAQGEILIFELSVTDNGGLRDTSHVNITVMPVNQPPVADAGDDRTVNEGIDVRLNGTASHDPEDGALIYEWRQTAGISVTLSEKTTPTPEFTAPDVKVNGDILIFELTVTDNEGLNDTDSVAITVRFVNQMPKADAGEDQSVQPGDTVTLNGSASYDPDNGIAKYQWQQIQGTMVTLSDSTSVQPIFVAKDLLPEGETLLFELTVMDNQGLKDTDQVAIHVSATHQPPVADAGDDQTVKIGHTVTLDGTGSFDPDGEIVAYEWVQIAGTQVNLLHPDAAQSSFVVQSVKPGGESLIFELTVTDNDALRNTDQVVIHVTYANQPPTADAGPDQTVSPGDTVILDGSNSADPDGHIAAYEWRQIQGVSVSLLNADTVRASFIASDGELSGKSLIFELTVTDNVGLQHSDQITINITDENQPPVADAGPDQTVSTGERVTLDGSGSYDPDGTIVTYLWIQISGPMITLSDITATAPTFMASENLKDKSLVFELIVSDNRGLQHTDRVTVNIIAEYYPPVADAGPDQTVMPGSTVGLDGSNSHDSGEIIAYQWRQISGVSVILSDATSSKPTFKAPAAGNVLIFELKVTDSIGLQSTDQVRITITSDNTPPEADAGQVQTVMAGAHVTLDGSGSSDPDPGDRIVSYQWRQISGISVTLSDADTAQPFFIAPDVSNLSLIFELTITDTGGLQDTDQVIINITLQNQAPVADAGVSQNITEGSTVRLNGSFSDDPDGEIARYQWHQTAGKGVTLSDTSNVRPTFVTPPVDINGATLIFQLTVTDNEGLQDTDTVHITIQDNGISDFPEDVLSFQSATDKPLGIKIETGDIIRLALIHPETISDKVHRPENLIYGLIHLELKVSRPGDTARVVIWLPETASGGYRWYKYTSANGWNEFDNALFNADRNQITLNFTDGASADEDGTANGIIIDPSGMGTPSPTNSNGKEAKDEETNCFISTVLPFGDEE